MQTVTEGLVLREFNLGESDRIITILTKKLGIVKASARGSRGLKSRLLSGTGLFCYSDFTLYRGRELYTVNAAGQIRSFYALRQSLEQLALAQYFSQIMIHFAPENDAAEEYLRLMLNALHLLVEKTYPDAQIKSVLELTLISLAGYMPDLTACARCGCPPKDDQGVMLLPGEGGFVCAECALSSSSGVMLDASAFCAMRYILSGAANPFAFRIPRPSLTQLELAAEHLTLSHADRGFPTLDFYRELVPLR